MNKPSIPYPSADMEGNSDYVLTASLTRMKGDHYKIKKTTYEHIKMKKT